jgi:hypothetical protein
VGTFSPASTGPLSQVGVRTFRASIRYSIASRTGTNRDAAGDDRKH